MEPARIAGHFAILEKKKKKISPDISPSFFSFYLQGGILRYPCPSACKKKRKKKKSPRSASRGRKELQKEEERERRRQSAGKVRASHALSPVCVREASFPPTRPHALPVGSTCPLIICCCDCGLSLFLSRSNCALRHPGCCPRTSAQNFFPPPLPLLSLIVSGRARPRYVRVIKMPPSHPRGTLGPRCPYLGKKVYICCVSS